MSEQESPLCGFKSCLSHVKQFFYFFIASRFAFFSSSLRLEPEKKAAERKNIKYALLGFWPLTCIICRLHSSVCAVSLTVFGRAISVFNILMKEHLNLLFVLGKRFCFSGSLPVASLEVEVAGIRLHVHPRPSLRLSTFDFRETPELHALH
jgi:hypothetical protein